MALTVPEYIVSATAVVASLVAATVGLQQLLSGPRLRHMEGTLREAAKATQDENQQRVLQSMHAATLGRIIAREAVPGLNFLSSILQIAVSLAAAVGVGLRDPDEWNIGPLITFSLFCWFGVRRATRLVAERLRVARAFENGESPVRAFTDTLAKMEGGHRWEILGAFIISASLVLAFARGPASLSTATVDSWQHVLPTVGGTMTAGTVLAITWMRLNRASTTEPRNRDDSLKPVWVHPRGAIASKPIKSAHSAPSC